MLTPDIEGKNNGELMINAIPKNNIYEAYMKSDQANCYNWVKGKNKHTKNKIKTSINYKERNDDLLMGNGILKPNT